MKFIILKKKMNTSKIKKIQKYIKIYRQEINDTPHDAFLHPRVFRLNFRGYCHQIIVRFENYILADNFSRSR